MADRARPEVVRPWLAQLGRGAGWYSVDWLDNGGKHSARHIASWIPEPQVGDASAVRYLRYFESGRALVLWVNGLAFFGARCRLVVDTQVSPANVGSRLVIRMSADAEGLMVRPALILFRFIDCIMAVRQLARFSQQFSTAAVDPGMSAALRSLGLLDVLSSTPAGPSVARLVPTPVCTASLRNLVRKAG